MPARPQNRRAALTGRGLNQGIAPRIRVIIYISRFRVIGHRVLWAPSVACQGDGLHRAQQTIRGLAYTGAPIQDIMQSR